MNQKTILITGASSGIGAATAKKLVAHGHKVALTARSEDKLKALQEELGSENCNIYPADATDPGAIEQVINEAAEALGKLDCVFANAGKGVSSAGTEDGDIEEWQSMLDVNINALLYTAKYSLPHLRKNHGHFILTSSAAGRATIKGSIYGASKWFAYGFGRNLAEEMAEWGGRCTTICPGMVNTPFFDEPKEDKLQPEDVADAVAYAIEAEQRNNVREVYLMPTNTNS
ncbi:SDR family oxidoreductase [Alteromonas sp. ASW11-130]|uniref:SDR family oxidoreductase n=1 Tax=Alteromonas sp. ASW11-130 TaxID=3015775 RepID=UPI002241BA6B|nr:SDR family oxidoreductase [Alteromonas sp. ASW11-130]MCW8091780.1 SDR family oxidoreductase [Alteromonas sp. ASW11-130]